MPEGTTEPYGTELTLDICNLDDGVYDRFTYESVRDFCAALCTNIGMERCGFNFVSSEAGDSMDAKTHGFSACQFIVQSAITMHGLDMRRSLYFNLFSCAPFDVGVVRRFVLGWFGGTVKSDRVVPRL